MKRILIVDDEGLIRYSLSAAFRNNLTETITSPDGRKALVAVGDWFFDFCFLDIDLHDMSGIDVMKNIRRLSPGTKMIIMTGSPVDDCVMNEIRDHAYLFLTKPFDLFRVKRVLDALPADEKNIYQDFGRLEERLATERRRHFRTHEEPRHITYVALGPVSEDQQQYYVADLIDISNAGACIRTAHDLHPGSMIRFKNCVNDAAGVVRWRVNDEQNQASVAGIQFLGD